MHFFIALYIEGGLLVWIVLSLRAKEQDAGTPDSRLYAPRVRRDLNRGVEGDRPILDARVTYRALINRTLEPVTRE